MKRIFLVASFLIVSVCSFAQKSYLHVFSKYDPLLTLNYDTSDIYLIGDKPSDMKDKYTYGHIEEIIEKLIGNGYTLEYVTNVSTTDPGVLSKAKVIGSLVYIFSKPSETPSAVRSVDIDNDGEVTEVARYNLEGIPVKESDKGIQIIVYSNYTTKIIFNK